MNLPLLCLKWYWFTIWLRAKGGHLGFYPQCNVQSNFWPHYEVGHTWKPYGRHRNHAPAPIQWKMTSIYCLTLAIWWPSWILLTMQCPFIVWPWSNGGHLGFFTHNVMSNIFSDNTTMSGILENLMIDTKNTNLRLSWWKWYQFIAWPLTNGGQLGFFSHNAISKIFYANTTMSGIPENPIIDTKKTRICLYYIKNDINLLFDLEQMATIFDFLPTMQCQKYFLTIPLCPAYMKAPG